MKVFKGKRVRFRKRDDTKYIYVLKGNFNDKCDYDFLGEARRKGNFDVDYHYLVHRNGLLETGIMSDDMYAGYGVPDWKEAVYIYIDVGLKGTLTDAQKTVLDSLIKKLRDKYEYAEVKEVQV